MRAVINVPIVDLPGLTSQKVRLAFRSAGYRVRGLRMRFVSAQGQADRVILNAYREGTYSTDDWVALERIRQALAVPYVDLVPFEARDNGIRIGGREYGAFKPEQFIYTTDYED